MSAIYECRTTPEERKILEELRSKLAKNFGVTLQGNRVTVRWYRDNELVDVHMIVESLTVPTERAEAREQYDALQKLYAKYPDLEAEMFHARHGE